jgi:hypothetical protein
VRSIAPLLLSLLALSTGSVAHAQVPPGPVPPPVAPAPVAAPSTPYHQQPVEPGRQIDYTAHVLGKGETRLGLASIDTAPVARVQLGTAPLLDLLGMYNARLKVQPLDESWGAISVHGVIMAVPITDLLKQLGGRNAFGVGNRLFVDSLTFTTIGAQGSLHAHERWSIHGGVSAQRMTGRGQFDFSNLPVVALPGADPIGGEALVVPRLNVVLYSVRLATDVRLNRRDSIVLQTNLPVFGLARAAISGSLDGLPEELANIDIAAQYRQALSPGDTYRASLAYQATFKRVDLRVGVGMTGLDKPLQRSWILETFDLAYRFGGKYAQQGSTP